MISQILTLALIALGGVLHAAEIHSLADMKGRRLAVLSGSAYQELTERLQDGIVYVPFNDVGMGITAVINGQVEAIVLDEPSARLWCAQRPNLLQLACVYQKDHYSYAFRKNSPLVASFNGVIARLAKEGELERYRKKWCEDANLAKPLDALPPKDLAKGVLRVGADPTFEPMIFLSNGNCRGFDAEVIARIAYELGYRVEFVTLGIAALVESLQSGRVDLIGGSLSVTAERQKVVTFCDPPYEGGLSLVTRSASAASAAGLSWADVKTSFRRTFVEESRGLQILGGLGYTVYITFFATLLGTLLAFPVWLLRTSRHRLLRLCGGAYVSLMQGTPVLVLLMILYYIVFAKCSISAAWVAIFGFALNLAAYAGEMLRTGIATVPRGQTEAALALGFSPLAAFLRVVLPQALRAILPVYRGEIIGLLKSTSIVGYVSVVDLTKASDLIRARTYEAFFPLVATAFIYFLLAWLLAKIIAAAERRLTPNP